MRAHLEMARRDPDYKFVLAELDYLKPYWDAYPEDRDLLRQLLGEGRLELMGGTYNEPNTNLTSAESTIRNTIYGVGFQRDVARRRPGDRLAARRVRARPAVPRDHGRRRGSPRARGRAGRSTSGGRCWSARPAANVAELAATPTAMQFPAEFEWLSPSRQGRAHAATWPTTTRAGWWMDCRT